MVEGGGVGGAMQSDWMVECTFLVPFSDYKNAKNLEHKSHNIQFFPLISNVTPLSPPEYTTV